MVEEQEKGDEKEFDFENKAGGIEWNKAKGRKQEPEKEREIGIPLETEIYIRMRSANIKLKMKKRIYIPIRIRILSCIQDMWKSTFASLCDGMIRLSKEFSEYFPINGSV